MKKENHVNSEISQGNGSHHKNGHTVKCCVAGFTVRIRVNWAPAVEGVVRSFDGYETSAESPALDVIVDQPCEFRCRQRRRNHFRAIYGNFLEALWEFDAVVRVFVRPRLFPVRAVRPLVDPEGHAIHSDVGRIIHERVILSFVQLLHADRMCFVHGAAMANEAGKGLLISGEGGVGKTSLALELGREYGWSFVSDDMVIVDKHGIMHLNANHPKLYAYNVLGDSALEQMLLRDDGHWGRLQWHLRKHWPNQVRREINPTTLYSATVLKAPLEWMLIVERTDVSEIGLQRLEVDAAAVRSTDILISELAKIKPAIDAYLASDVSRLDHTWNSTMWTETLGRSLSNANLFLVRVPKAMQAIPYRREMASIIAKITNGQGSE